MAWYRTSDAALTFVSDFGAILAVAGSAPSQTITLTPQGGTAKTLSSPGGNAVYTTTAAANAQLLKMIDTAEREVIVDGSSL